MSFSGDVKNELINSELNMARHCMISGIYALINSSAQVITSAGRSYICLYTENNYLAALFSRLIVKAFAVRTECFVKINRKSGKRTYYVAVYGNADVVRILKAINYFNNENSKYNHLILRQECCKRAYLKAAFVAGASISDPGKNYHLEYVLSHEQSALSVVELLTFFSLKPKMILRKKNYVVYIKDGEKISDLLALIGAHQSYLEFENLRVFKTVSNEVNRKVNCETANMAKTAKAFVSFQEDIEFIERFKGLSYLSKPLLEIAELRLENPNATLKEIGEMTIPPISKSGVNHRLRKIGEIAEKLRGD